MKIITLLNEKGGVAKTTIATHIAAGLAIRGYRVVLVDADPQGHATIAYGLAKEPAFYDLIVRGAAFKDVLRLVPPERYTVPDSAGDVRGQLYVIPSNIETRSIPTSIEDGFIVLKRMNELRQAVDYVIFDTSPTPSLLHGSIYMATDGILYPTKLEVWSFDGLRESMVHKNQFTPIRQQYNLPEIEILGIIPTMKRQKTIEHKENERILKERFGELVWEAMPERTIWAEAASAKKMVYSIAPGSKTEGDAWRIVDTLMERVHAR